MKPHRVTELDNKCKKMFEEKCRYELQNRELISKVNTTCNNLQDQCSLLEQGFLEVILNRVRGFVKVK